VVAEAAVHLPCPFVRIAASCPAHPAEACLSRPVEPGSFAAAARILPVVHHTAAVRTRAAHQVSACSGRHTEAVAACHMKAAVAGPGIHTLLLPELASLDTARQQVAVRLHQHLRRLQIHKLVQRMRASSCLPLPAQLVVADHIRHSARTVRLQDPPRRPGMEIADLPSCDEGAEAVKKSSLSYCPVN